MTNEKRNYTNFTTDWEKMYDFWGLTKDEFLKSYPHLTEEEYNLTCDETIGCHICGHEIPMRVTRDDFKEAIRVQLHNFRAKYNHESAEYVYNKAYTIAKHEAIAHFLLIILNSMTIIRSLFLILTIYLKISAITNGIVIQQLGSTGMN